MNKLILIGNLTKDPEVSQTAIGTAYCKFTVAVSRAYTTNGEKQTDFFNITAWRAQAENCGKYLKKGSKVAVMATLQNRSYEDNNGVKRSTNEIIAETVEFLSSNRNDAQSLSELTPIDEPDEDMPF